MAKRSTILRNWPKYLLQWGVLAALIVFITGIIPSEEAVDPETYCPMGGLQALATYLANNSLPCSMSSVQVMMGIALVAAVVLFSKLFCAYTALWVPCRTFSARHATPCTSRASKCATDRFWTRCSAL